MPMMDSMRKVFSEINSNLAATDSETYMFDCNKTVIYPFCKIFNRVHTFSRKFQDKCNAIINFLAGTSTDYRIAYIIYNFT